MRAYLFCATLALCFAANPAFAAITHITVQNTNDSGPGSLRQAILDSTSTGTIDFTNTVFATAKTIVLSSTNDVSSGPSALNINKPLFILGPTAPNAVTLSVSPSSPMRLFRIVSDGGLTLSNLVLAGGQAVGGAGGDATQRGGAGGGAAGLGGAIFNEGAVVTLLNCVFGTNQAVGGVGGSCNATSFGYGQGAGGGGGGMGGAGGLGGDGSIGGIGGPPGIAPGGTNNTAGANGGISGGGGGGGSQGFVAGSGPGGAGGFGGGGGGGGAYNTEGFPGGTGGPGGNGGFGGGGGGGGAGTPDGVRGSGGFGGGAASISDNSGNNGTGGGGGAGFGGAIFNDGGTLNITNCTFSKSSVAGGAAGSSYSASGGNGAAYGGAIFNRNGSVIISDGSFIGNTGGDVYNLGDGAGKVAKVTLLSVTASETNNAINGGAALSTPVIASAGRLSNGKFQLSFTNFTTTNFTVIASTNPNTPLSNWISLGSPTQAVGNLYQFTDPTPSNRNFFYQLRFP